MVVINAMEIAISKLTQLGFSHYEAKAYTALLRDNPLTAYEIAKNSGVPTSKVYEVIRKLERRNTIQSIHGKRSKLFIPISPDEFIDNFKLTVDNNLNVIRNELKGIKVGIDSNYTWHMNNYEDLILRAKRMLQTAREYVIMMIWPEECLKLREDLDSAQERGLKLAMVYYGTGNVKVGRVYRHSVEDTVYSDRNIRGLTLVADSREALIGKMAPSHTEAIWSMNETFVIITEDYLRHDIYLIKTMMRFDPVMKKAFGDRYERLVDIYEDEKS
jgi:sugar-specific transcriptional regulator TrmB